MQALTLAWEDVTSDLSGGNWDGVLGPFCLDCPLRLVTLHLEGLSSLTGRR